MLGLEREHLGQRGRVRKLRDRIEVLAQLLLGLVVVARRALGVEAQAKLSGQLAKELCDARVELRRLLEPLPHGRPLPRPLDEGARGVAWRLLVGVELELGRAHPAERLPARLALGRAERVAEAHPAQQVARRIAHR